MILCWKQIACGPEMRMSLMAMFLLLATVVPILAVSYKALESGRECD